MPEIIALLTYLTSLDASKFGIILLLMLVGFVVTYGWSKIFKKHIVLRFGLFSVEVGKEFEKKHEEEPARSDMLKKNKVLVFENLRKFIQDRQQRIDRLYNDIIARQINYCEEQIFVMKDMFMEDFALALKKKLPDHGDPRIHPAFRNYRMMVDLMLDECVKEQVFKRSMKMNHLAELNMTTWETFIIEKVNSSFSRIREFYDDNYPEDSLVTRIELDEQGRTLEKIKPLIISMYRKAREISIENRSRIASIQEEIDRMVKNESVDSLCGLCFEEPTE